MNYNHFLNKSNTFKNKNIYRLENKKKTRKGFLFFSVLSITAVAALLVLFIDSNATLNHSASAEATSDESSHLTLPEMTVAPSSEQPSSGQKSLALDLPQIDTLSKTELAVSEPVSRLTVLNDNVTVNTVEKTAENTITESTEVHQEPTPVLTDIVITANEQSEKPLAIINEEPFVVSEKPLATVNQEPLAVVSETPLAVVNQASLAIVTSDKTRTIVVKNGDTLSAIFKRLSLSASTLYNIVNSSKLAKRLTRIKPGQQLLITFNENNQFKSLQYELDRVDTLIITKQADNNNYVVRVESKEIELKQQFAASTITNSLFASGYKAGLSSAMIMKLAQLFGWDIDFALDIRKGDSFAVLFEEKYIDGKKIGNGNILSAEFVNRGKVFQAIRYTDASGYTDYYSEKGLSMRKAFLRSPVEFSRISSRFSSGRKHPVLNRIRAHKGVDYAASRGTPIKSVGDGKVIYKGKKGGYGRVIIIQHGSKYTTLYAHMNSYNRKIKRGGRVKQGQVIGYVGSSGLATGPHLHYEFRMNGVHRNPLTVPLPSASPIAKKYRHDFQAVADTMVSQLKLRKQATVALSEQ